MLSHTNRFHGHGGLRYLYRNGKTARTRSFLLRFISNDTRVHSRVTVIVSKKTMKSAARRNRIRRRVYEVVRRDWDNLRHPFDVSITVYAAEVGLIPAEQLTRELTQLFNTARLYKTTPDRDKIDKTKVDHVPI